MLRNILIMFGWFCVAVLSFAVGFGVVVYLDQVFPKDDLWAIPAIAGMASVITLLFLGAVSSFYGKLIKRNFD